MQHDRDITWSEHEQDHLKQSEHEQDHLKQINLETKEQQSKTCMIQEHET